MFYNEVMEKDPEISGLKVHSQKLLAQVKKSKATKQSNQRLEQEKDNW
jgi:hypothetical protein